MSPSSPLDVIPLVAALLFFAGQSEPPSDPEAIRHVFHEYKRALLEGDGEAAVDLVDARTLSYWERIKELALRGDEETVRGQSFIDRLLIVSMRHQLGVEELEAMGLADLVRHVVENGWIQPQSIRQLGLGEIVIEGDEATGEALTGGATSTPPPDSSDAHEPLRYRFVREGGEWKFRFSSLVEGLNEVVTRFSEQLGTEEDDLIFQLVEGLSGRRVLPEVWERPTPETAH